MALKPAVPDARVAAWLARRCGDARDLRRLREGLAAQAFTFRRGGEGFVLRLSPHIAGFRKDAYASRAFGRPALPIPEVLEVGPFGADLAFCISRRAPGRRLQDLDAESVSRLAPQVAAAMAAIAATDIAATRGFGRFDATGAGPQDTWRAFLLGIADRNWAPVRRRVDPGLLDRLLAEVRALAPACPEVRRLIHGDFGGGNVLSDGRTVTAVIDWDLALLGDPLYDWASLAFWGEDCLRPTLALAPRACPGYGERMRCYTLRFALEEIHGSATGRTPVDLGWLVARSAALLS